MTDWDALRADVPGTAGKTYLNSCSMGLPSQAVLDALHDYGASWSALGAASWHDAWIDAHDAWRKAMARLLGARADDVCWVPSVGAALASLGSALLRDRIEGRSARDELVLGDLEFPAALAGLGQRPGTVVRTAASTGGRIASDAYTDLLGPRTEALLASRVLFSTGAVQDVTLLCRATRAAGAFSIVDDYQGLGQLVGDVGATGADATVGGSLKWLCGGVASAFLHVRRDRIASLRPMHYGWWANQDMFAFDGHFTPAEDARRFMGGEVNVPGLLTSLAAVERLLAIGPGRIERRTQELARDLRERLADARVPVLDLPVAERSAIVMVPRRDAHGESRLLQRASIIVDERNGALRASPHYYNTLADNERLVAALTLGSAGAPATATVSA